MRAGTILLAEDDPNEVIPFRRARQGFFELSKPVNHSELLSMLRLGLHHRRCIQELTTRGSAAFRLLQREQAHKFRVERMLRDRRHRSAVNGALRYRQHVDALASEGSTA